MPLFTEALRKALPTLSSTSSVREPKVEDCLTASIALVEAAKKADIPLHDFSFLGELGKGAL